MAKLSNADLNLSRIRRDNNKSILETNLGTFNYA